MYKNFMMLQYSSKSKVIWTLILSIILLTVTRIKKKKKVRLEQQMSFGFLAGGSSLS